LPSVGSFTNWNVTYPFNIGNTASLDRPWSGTVRQIAVYDRALLPNEIQQNHDAGPDVAALSGGAGGTVAFQAQADTHIDVRSPLTNFGNSTDLGLGAGSSERVIYLRYDIQGLPGGAAIVDAYLQMRVSNGGGAGTIRLFNASDPLWDEGLPTWDAPLAGSDGSGDMASPGTVSIGQDLQYTNLGGVIPASGPVSFVIRSNDEDGSAFRSSEYSDIELRPTLFVTYSSFAGAQPPTAAARADQLGVDDDDVVTTSSVPASHYPDRP